MKNLHIIPLLISLTLALFTTNNLTAQKKYLESNHKNEPDKILDNPVQSVMDINNITSWVGNDGFHNWIVGGSWNGAYPNGLFIGSVFSEGIVWGGLVSDVNEPVVRVNGNTWGSGCSPYTRLYRIRPDFLTGNLDQDASNFFNIPIGQVTQNQIDELRQQYQTDWNEWPANEGAPFKDVDENGIYDPLVDIPGVSGSSQTLFIKYDDDQVPLYGSLAIGLEVTETYWAYSASGSLGNIIFKKINILYVGTPATPPGSYIDSMYICQWADPDVGTSTDDFAGCDTTLNLGYSYNANPTDDVYLNAGLNPPAVGYSFLHGVAEYTGNFNDSAIINFEWKHGYKYVNLKSDGTPVPMSSFIYIAAGGTWQDPAFFYTGTLEFYNLMRGKRPDPPYPAADPFPSSVADYTPYGCFLLTGDPVAGTGKIDGSLDAPGDRRIVSVSGPFHLELGKSAEVVIGLVAGLGNDYLNSITKLKENTFVADTAFLGLVKSGQVLVVNVKSDDQNNQIPENFILYQNYPNPFNPTTTIAYQIPERDFVTLKVYDILGREVATLVNEEKPAGTYEVQFAGRGLTSGIYFYQLKSGNYLETKKMILIK